MTQNNQKRGIKTMSNINMIINELNKRFNNAVEIPYGPDSYRTITIHMNKSGDELSITRYQPYGDSTPHYKLCGGAYKCFTVVYSTIEKLANDIAEYDAQRAKIEADSIIDQKRIEEAVKYDYASEKDFEDFNAMEEFRRYWDENVMATTNDIGQC